MFEMLFTKNGITYVVQTLPEKATSTLDILLAVHLSPFGLSPCPLQLRLGNPLL
jgi:hypothetical protein